MVDTMYRIVEMHALVAEVEHGPQMHGVLLLVALGVAIAGGLVYLWKRRR